LAIGSLCKFYRNELDEFPKTPYLKANAEISQKYKDKLNSLSNRKKIGISWRGGTTDTGELFRRIELEKWVDLFKEDFDFISLQYKDDAEKDLQEFNDKYPEFKIHHWRDVIDDYDETAGLIDNLDLIISVPQSIVHLAGAMGVKTLQLTPYRHMWQMGKFGEDMPWYDSVKNIWQKEHGKWDDVMKEAKEHLCSL
jgi:ADP-heptose:LPS heptosyltransferase